MNGQKILNNGGLLVIHVEARVPERTIQKQTLNSIILRTPSIACALCNIFTMRLQTYQLLSNYNTQTHMMCLNINYFHGKPCTKEVWLHISGNKNTCGTQLKDLNFNSN